MAMAAQMSKMSEDSIYREELHKGRLYKVSGRLCGPLRAGCDPCDSHPSVRGVRTA